MSRELAPCTEHSRHATYNVLLLSINLCNFPTLSLSQNLQEVLRLSRELALRTLQLEMEYAYRALEDEALDVVGFDANGESFSYSLSLSSLSLSLYECVYSCGLF